MRLVSAIYSPETAKASIVAAIALVECMQAQWEYYKVNQSYTNIIHNVFPILKERIIENWHPVKITMFLKKNCKVIKKVKWT